MSCEILLTRRVTFHARHRMSKPGWSDEQGEKLFGAAAKAPGHSHLYRVAVTVGGRPDPDTGTLIDLGLLDGVLAEMITAPLDGKDLNEVVPEFARGETCPGCESLATILFRRVTSALPDGSELYSVVVAEDETLEAECRRGSTEGNT